MGDKRRQLDLSCSPPSPRRLLGVFAKYWQAGAVKTRLGQALGPQDASSIYLAFLRTIVQRFQNVTSHPRLVFSPSSRAAEFAELISGTSWEIRSQAEGDLGQRMEHFFLGAFHEGFGPVVLLGSDTPDLPLEYVEQAFTLLQQYPVVLGPSDDGGYYLIGLATCIPPIFNDMPWSTAEVWKQTVARLQDSDLPFAQLPPWYDVDEFPDLRRLLENLECDTEPELVQLRGAVRMMIGS